MTYKSSSKSLIPRWKVFKPRINLYKYQIAWVVSKEFKNFNLSRITLLPLSTNLLLNQMCRAQVNQITYNLHSQAKIIRVSNKKQRTSIKMTHSNKHLVKILLFKINKHLPQSWTQPQFPTNSTNNRHLLSLLCKCLPSNPLPSLARPTKINSNNN